MVMDVFIRTALPIAGAMILRSVFSTREHILPESLGGGDMSLSRGVVLRLEPESLGSEIEQMVLGDYPFSFCLIFLVYHQEVESIMVQK